MNDYIYTSFDINRDSYIVIYGAGPIGERVCKSLITSNYNVKCIIDRDAHNKKHLAGVPVICIEDICDEVYYSKDIVVIVCLQNGVHHQAIASEVFLKLKTKHILYLPSKRTRSSEEFRRLQMAYTDILNKRYETLIAIPDYRVLHEPFNVISLNEHYISFFCPVKYIKTAPLGVGYDKYEIDQEKAKQVTQFFDAYISDNYAYFELFDWCFGKSEYPATYLLTKKIYTPDLDEKEYLCHRKELVSIFKYSFTEDVDFFSFSPSECYLTPEKNEIYMMDGTHRACFLIYMGIDKVPILLTSNDYQTFIDALTSCRSNVHVTGTCK